MTRSTPHHAKRPWGKENPAHWHSPMLVLVAILIATFTLPALADNGPVFKKRRDKDVTIIIIDDKDRNRKRFVPEDKRKPAAATTFKRRKDNFRIRIPHQNAGHGTRPRPGHLPRNRIEHQSGHAGNSGFGHGATGHRGNSGPKVIIVDRNSSGCKGSGVCVIRP